MKYLIISNWEISGNEILTTSASANVNYSDIQGGYEGENNIDADPLFTDIENGDFIESLGVG